MYLTDMFGWARAGDPIERVEAYAPARRPIPNGAAYGPVVPPAPVRTPRPAARDDHEDRRVRRPFAPSPRRGKPAATIADAFAPPPLTTPTRWYAAAAPPEPEAKLPRAIVDPRDFTPIRRDTSTPLDRPFFVPPLTPQQPEEPDTTDESTDAGTGANNDVATSLTTSPTFEPLPYLEPAYKPQTPTTTPAIDPFRPGIAPGRTADTNPYGKPVSAPAAPTNAPELTLPDGWEDWQFTTHAIQRRRERYISPAEAVMAAMLPEQTRTCIDRPECMVHILRHVQVVVNVQTKTIVTVINRNMRDDGQEGNTYVA